MQFIGQVDELRHGRRQKSAMAASKSPMSFRRVGSDSANFGGILGNAGDTVTTSPCSAEIGIREAILSVFEMSRSVEKRCGISTHVISDIVGIAWPIVSSIGYAHRFEICGRDAEFYSYLGDFENK